MNSDRILNTTGKYLNNQLIQELRDQGHYLTGSLENSISTSFRVVNSKKHSEALGFALDYAIRLNQPTHEIRFLPTVTELRNYFILRGLSPMEAMEAAVLTAKRHKVEGMPTKASSRFSKTGVRTEFIDRTWKNSEQKIDSMIEAGMDQIFDNEFKKQKAETI